MTRRNLLLALLAACAVPAGAAVRRLPDGCPPTAYAELMEKLRQWNSASSPPHFDDGSLREIRENMAGTWEAPGATWIPLEPIRLRVIRPEKPALGVLLNYHGGGWVAGTALSDEPFANALVQKTGWAVVSVDYRLAPENPFPQPVTDSVAAARWLLENGEREFGTRRFAMQGRSAGSHLAALALQQLGPEARRFLGAVLYYGLYDLSGTLRLRMAEDQEFPDLQPTAVWQFIDWFTPGMTAEARAASDVSPLAGPVQNLPKALFLVGTADVLLDDTLLMAQRWGSAAEVEVVQYPGGPHGFDGYNVAGVTDPQTYVAQFLATL